MKKKVAIIGPGRVGATLGRLFVLSDFGVQSVVGNRPETAAEGAKFIGAPLVTDLEEAVRGADVVAICVPDREVPGVAAELASVPLADQAVVFHTSGSLSSRNLETLRSKNRGVALASAHPLQSFASPKEAMGRMRGVTWSIEGDERALAFLDGMVAGFGGKPIRIQTDGKPLYHAAAAVASNYLVAILDVAVSLAEASGMPRESVIPAFRPLMEGSLANFSRLGAVEGLTGPISRGDTTTVSRHMVAIRTRLPQVEEVYRALGRYALQLAQQKKSFPPGAAAEIEALFKGT